MADVRITQYPLKSIVSDNDIFLIADSNDVDVNGFLKYKKVRAKDLPSIVNTAESITYANLMAAIAADDLIIGTFYRITDSTSGVSPLLVQAVGVDAIGYLAFDGTNPLVTINYDVMTDTIRWSLNQTVAPISLGSLSATTPLSYNNTTGVFTISQSNTTTNGYLSSADWNTFTAKQNAGNYITALTGEATASGPGGGGSAAITLDNTAVIGKVLSGLNVTGGNVVSTDSILTAFGKTQNQINALVGGVMFQGVWDAATNNPALTSSVGTKGYYYVVNVAGSTNLNGITDWKVGDWAIFDGTAWQKVDNTDSVSSVFGRVGAVVAASGDYTTTQVTEGTNLYYTEARVDANSNVAANTAARHNAVTLGTANGLSLSTQQLSLGLSSASANGALSSTDWSTFSGKQNALGGTGIVKSTGGTISYLTDNSTNWNTAYNDSIVSAGVTGTSTKTLTLNQQDGGTVTASWSDADTGLTSVGLSMPSAFSVANSPLTANGTLAVTGAGVASQYVRGDGTLAAFPTTSGGGSSVSYYFNGGTNQGTIGGNTYYEMSTTAVIGTGADFNINTNGYVAQFVTDANDPSLLSIPAGNWNFEMWFSASSGGGSPSFYLELYKYNGATLTLISSGSAVPEVITGGTSIDLYTTALAVPLTTLALTDRLAVRVYVNHSSRTITLHTQNGHLCQAITTFSTGLTALNGLTAQVQNLTVGTSGTDFAISSLTDTHTFNLPTASATNRGALNSTDWSVFNGKQNALTLTTTGTSGAATLVGATLNIPQYTDQFVGTVTSVSALTLGTTGTDLSSSVANGTTTPVITLNVPTASATNRGALSSTDWTTFNNKTSNLGTVTSVGLTSATSGVTIGSSPVTTSGDITLAIATASGSLNGLLSSTDWTTFNNKASTAALANYLPLAGGTLTGALNGGLATFTDRVLGTGLVTRGSTLNNNNNIKFLRAGDTEMAYIGWVDENTNNSTWLFKSSNANPIAFSADGVNQNLFISSVGNIGIGTTSPVAITDYKNLEIRGTTGALLYMGTTAATASLRLIGDGTNGYIENLNTTGSLIFGTNTATERMRITSAGFVGIATTAPTALLQVKGESPVTPGARYLKTQIGGGTSWGLESFEELAVGFNGIRSIFSGGDNWDISFSAGTSTTWSSGTQPERMRITATGNVGIATLRTPGEKLQVQGNIRLTGADIITANTLISEINSYAGSTNQFKTASIKLFTGSFVDQGFMTFNTSIGGSDVERMRISEAGDVGIGTTSPSSKLDIRGASGTQIRLSSVDNYHIAGLSWEDGTITLAAGGYGSPDLRFSTAGTERMRITSAGVLYVNQTTASAAGAGTKMQVATDMLTTGSLAGYFFEDRNGGVTASANWYGWYAASGAVFLYNGSANIASISGATGIYTPLSDVNKKKDFEASTIGLNEVLQLKPTLYRMKTDDESAPKELGFIAQEVKEFIPQAYVESGEEDSKFIGLNDRPIIAALVKAVQEQNQLILDLQARLNSLESK